ncbi:hypothetical protein CSV79_00810 [Sporosarcina sp. P13]|uniref:hypothetical protein n=1 Tax=Sporosarcina sp. P13 TaxID=2048263 RepID=UPI000C169571|nr:hypothetical protein [Sporosarcina sp. P13]PIC65649.1 hypothetical protein CSV79_00810 [Sporosarcina sp. P13]
MNMSTLSISSTKVTSTETQPLILKEGQMIHGKVQQLFPGQTAQIQVGNQQLYAKLEVPMQAGDNYYFKVNSTEPELQLQVISGPIQSAEGQTRQLSQLMDSLNVPKTPEMKELLAMVIKQRIPITKENLLEAANLLKTAPEGMKAEALATISKIANARLPFTPVVFQSLLQAQMGTISQQLTTLQVEIQNESNLSPAVREKLLDTLQALANPVSQSVGKELLKRSLSQLLDPQASKADRFAALQLLKSADILPPRTSLANLPQVLAQLVTQSGDGKAVIPFTLVVAPGQVNQTIPKAVQTLFRQLIQTPVANQTEVQTIVRNLMQQLTNSTLPETMKNSLQTMLAQFTRQPITESAKTALTQQFSQVFTTSIEQALTNQAVAPTGQTVEQSNTIITLKNVKNFLSQLNQTSVANQQTIKEIIQNLTQQLSNPTLPKPMKNALQTILNQFTQQAPSDSTKATFIEQFSQTLLQQVSRQELPMNNGAASQQTIAKDVQQTLPALLSLPPEQVEEALHTLLQVAEKSGNLQVKQMIQAAEMQLSQVMNGPIMKEAIQSVLSTLGLNYEALLSGKEPDLANLANTLKPQLLALLHDPSLSPLLREAAETMVLRMNGTIIQTGDTSVQQQFIMQLPLELFGEKIDATLQWNGRMRENGQIDPAFARILFYLDLEALETTLVDMHVQNKVVNLTIFNKQPSLRTTGLSFQPLLKEGLERVGYKLSGITFKPFVKSPQPVEKTTNSFYANEGGVDYKI